MARPHARGIGRGADGAGRPVKHRAVRGVSAGPAEALDATLEALALGGPHDVHDLSRREQLGRHALADLVALQHLALLEPDLADHPHRRHVGLLEDPGGRLADVLLLGLEAQLQRVVAVALERPEAQDRAGSGLDDGDGDLVAVVPEDLGHADLAADESFFPRHGSWSLSISESDQKWPDA